MINKLGKEHYLLLSIIIGFIFIFTVLPRNIEINYNEIPFNIIMLVAAPITFIFQFLLIIGKIKKKAIAFATGCILPLVGFLGSFKLLV